MCSKTDCLQCDYAKNTLSIELEKLRWRVEALERRAAGETERQTDERERREARA